MFDRIHTWLAKRKQQRDTADHKAGYSYAAERLLREGEGAISTLEEEACDFYSTRQQFDRGIIAAVRGFERVKKGGDHG